MADLFQIFFDAGCLIFLFQLFDHAIHQHRGGFLLQVAQLAGQFPRKRERFPVDHREFLPEHLVLALDFLGHRCFELALVHQLGDVFDGHHLAFQHRKNLGERHGPHLHVAQGELLARDAPREIVHQLFLAHREAVHDPPLLALERLPFKHLRDAPPQKFDARLHVFLEWVGLAARQREQSRPVWVFEIMDVAAVQRRLRGRLNLLDHPRNHAAAAGAGQAAHKHVVARRGKFHAHLQGAQRALLPDDAFPGLCLRRCCERNARGVAPPPKLFGGKLSRR